jgi:hypothetical protein
MKHAQHKILRQLARARLTSAMVSLGSTLMKYSQDQPRVPAGDPTGGQWRRTRVAGKWNERNREDCEVQYETDMFQCKFVVS